MADFRIRLGRPSDPANLAGLRHALRSRKQDIESEAEFLQRCTAWMADALASTTWRCWVVEQEGTLIGALWLQLVEKIPNPTAAPELFAYITNFFVIDESRGKGVGSALLAEVLEWCKQKDVDEVILWPTEKSRSLYERHGFKVTPDLLELVMAKR